jgi:hypothetical protein
MSNNNGLVAFAAGLGGGYLQAKQRNQEQARIDEDRAMRKQEFDARMEELNSGKQQRISLANAAAPLKATEVTDIDPNNPSAPRKTSYSLSDGRVLGSKAEADAAAIDYNKPEAQTERIAAAYRTSGAPEKAMTLENAALTQKRTKEQYTQEVAERARKLQEEGVFSALRSFRSGDAGGLAKAFNAGGEYKLDGDPVVTKEDREVPGIGVIPTYTAKVRIKGPDGQVQEKTYNSHDLSMQMLPYEKQLEIQRKGTDSDNKASYQSAMLDAKVKQYELAGQVAEAKALKAAANGGPIGREERLRYTSLFSDAGRRMGESQRALSSLQKDPLFMMNAKKDGTPEQRQLQELQSNIKSFSDERSLYQGLLAGSQTPGKQPSLSDANPKTPAAKPKATGNGDFSALWK